MFVQSERFVEEHGGHRRDIAVYGQESNPTTWRLCKMNLAIRGIGGNIGPNNADTFLNDLHKDLRADFILANPPFNMSEWGGQQLQGDARWQYGQPPNGNANYAWMQHMIYHLAPNGVLGLVLANGSMSTNQSGEGDIRRRIVDADLVDCIVALPGQLFYNVQIPVCLWFITRNKRARSEGHPRPARRDALHRRAADGPSGGPHAPRPDRGGYPPHCRCVPRLAREGMRARRGDDTRTWRASVRRRNWTRYAATTTC